ncbi:MAG: hypothetical protein FWG65_08525 [Turicibacter sp.]|nr:hypothetical protein [Turicibacter sp.]
MLKTYDELAALLHKLDDLLVAEKWDYVVQLRVIGGFSLLYYDLRVTSPTSNDIDLFDEMSAKLYYFAQQIEDSNWLNDDAYSVKQALPARILERVVFVPARLKFRRIELFIAKIESIVALKLYALEKQAARGYTAASNPRIQDLQDLRDIFSHYKIATAADFLREFPGLDCYTALLREYGAIAD